MFLQLKMFRDKRMKYTIDINKNHFFIIKRVARDVTSHSFQDSIIFLKRPVIKQAMAETISTIHISALCHWLSEYMYSRY